MINEDEKKIYEILEDLEHVNKFNFTTILDGYGTINTLLTGFNIEI